MRCSVRATSAECSHAGGAAQSNATHVHASPAAPAAFIASTAQLAAREYSGSSSSTTRAATCVSSRTACAPLHSHSHSERGRATSRPARGSFEGGRNCVAMRAATCGDGKRGMTDDAG